MARRDVAYRDPTGDTAVGRVMRAQETHADLGLGYPPDDHTEDLRPKDRISDAAPKGWIPDPTLHSKKPPVSSAKTTTEGNQTTTQQEVDPS